MLEMFISTLPDSTLRVTNKNWTTFDVFGSEKHSSLLIIEIYYGCSFEGHDPRCKC
jgi:hypothetical protein